MIIIESDPYLLRKGQFEWTPLKEAITTAPVPVLPNFSQTFHDYNC